MKLQRLSYRDKHWTDVGQGLAVRFGFMNHTASIEWQPREPTRGQWHAVRARVQVALLEFQSRASLAIGKMVVVEQHTEGSP